MATSKTIDKKTKILGALAVCGILFLTGAYLVGAKYYVSDKKISKLQENLKKVKQDLVKQKELLVQSKERQENFIDQSYRYWYVTDTTNLSQIGKYIEYVAAENEISLNSMSEVKNQFKSADGCSVLDFSISVNGNSYEKIIKFMAAIRNLRPVFNWQSLQMFRNERSSEDQMFVNGSLRVVIINNPTIVQLLGDNLPVQEIPVHKTTETTKASSSSPEEKELAEDSASEDKKELTSLEENKKVTTPPEAIESSTEDEPLKKEKVVPETKNPTPNKEEK